MVLLITRFNKLNTKDSLLLGYDVASVAHRISALQDNVMYLSLGVEVDILNVDGEGSTLS